jgi:hypothetical protein
MIEFMIVSLLSFTLFQLGQSYQILQQIKEVK